MGKGKRVALYVRVSTDGQTTVNQQRELEAVAERHGWTVVETFRDHGISGKNGREKRPGFDKLLQGIARRDFDLIAAWSVDRLGRSLQHLISFLEGATGEERRPVPPSARTRHVDSSGTSVVPGDGRLRRV
jgi:DNA invertase Pin-like site-specific DNA recombinase